MTSSIIGISCVYGVTISYTDLLNMYGFEDESELSLLPGLNIYTHPDWEDDTVIIGITIVSLDIDPSMSGSTLAPVVTIPDIIDFRQYSDDMPRYYQIPIIKN